MTTSMLMNREVMSEFPALVEVVETMCDQLREVRRHRPELYFGRAEEELYDRLEGALEGYYRAQYEEKVGG